MISDPVFLEAIKRLKENKPITYQHREIDLYNAGKDAVQQKITVLGNTLEILDFPEYYEIHIQLNETTNPPIRLKKGIILCNFFRFFLTYRHTDKTNIYGEPFLLKLLISKDLLSITYPTSVEKASLELVPGELFTILAGSGKQVLTCKHAYCVATYYFYTKNYNHIRGLISQSSTSEKKLYITEFITDDLQAELSVDIPPNKEAVEFFIDLSAPKFKFSVDRDSGADYTLYFYVKAWCM